MKIAGAPFRRLRDIVPSLVDERVGIVQQVFEVPREAGAPDFFHFASRACNTRAFTRQENFSTAGGASTDRETALAKAVGEAVERYCAAIYEVEELPLASAADAPFPCVPPEAFALYGAEQLARPGFPWAPFEPDTPVRWTPARDPLTGETRWVPAAMVYIPYLFYQGTGDAPVVQPISTGLACHVSPAAAAVSGLCEVVERDAFTIMWQARLGMPQIRVETLSDRNYDLVARFERTGATITLLWLTLDAGIPTVLAVLRSPSPVAPALAFAAATALDPEEAVRKSLEELAHTRRYSQQITTSLPRLVPEPGHANVVDQMGHLNFWCDHANAPLADFVFASSQRLEFDELPRPATGSPAGDLEVLCRRLEGVGHRVLIADVTTPDVRDLGLAVVRAVVPGFHPLFMGFGIRALGGRRLWEVPQKLGHRGITRAEGDNPYPHPYP